ncbi:Sir2 family NAD-dependent protein deacetylase [Streptomyces sp. NPDC096323]|uniref:SIR2 family NAD-dependent protein deacylase n=1 Tax=Streptomyces sp. NPDC096323 TaxID=3155822 RepID=UPI00331E9CC8
MAILSGAGISTDSGIPGYRGPKGPWRKAPEAEKLVQYDAYMADPDIRRRSWQLRRTSATWNAEPNAAHRAVAALERSGVAVRVITQNVDGLHQAAGLSPRERLDPVVLSQAMAVAKGCEVFVAVGTTLQVQPAASLAGIAAEHGARLIVMNAEPTPYDAPAQETIREPIGTAPPALLERLADEAGPGA